MTPDRNISRRLLTLLMLLLTAGGTWAQKTYVVCVGLNYYDNGERPLPCSDGDARGMAEFFDHYNGSEVFMLLNENATRNHILRVLRSKLAKATPQDEVIFAYSGHGFDGGISCYDTRNVVYCSEVQQLMRQSRAGRKIMFINSCHSGSFAKKYGRSAKASAYKSTSSDVMLYLSSRANEYSWERTDMRMSFFFTRLISALRGKADKNGDRLVTARELFNYVNAGVISDTQGQQHPQMYGRFSDNMVVVRVKP